jgi:glycosidase
MRSALALVLPVWGLWACCEAPPVWSELDTVTVAKGVEIPIDLSELATGEDLSFTAVAGKGVGASMNGSILTLTGGSNFDGYTSVELTARNACGQTSVTNLTVDVATGYTGATCPVTLSSDDPNATAVYAAGTFNGWSSSATPLEQTSDGHFEVTLDLLPGAYAYKFVSFGNWRCDPTVTAIACSEGQSWDRECTSTGNSCNSLLVVPRCSDPIITVTNLDIDRDRLGLAIEAHTDQSPKNAWATLDGDAVDGWEGTRFIFARFGLSPGRHTLRLGADGSEEVYVPFWLDDRRWESGLLYFAFVDRFYDGDTGNDFEEGATVDYAGGDWAGVTARLDYLDDLGVTALWLTSPLDNAEAGWEGDCNATYSAYHGYWPDSGELEEHFGTSDELTALVQAAHDRNMRVMVDWVGNHVHENHNLYGEHPEWFNEKHICKEDDDGDGQVNWDQRPETCWFASYLPDIDYAEEEILARQVDDAIALARDLDLDGFRIDAVKHMPVSVTVNLQDRVYRDIEHGDAGGTQDFRTIGETFDGYDKIAAYIGEGQLDAQFDFPLYYAILQAFARDEIGLSNGSGSLQDSLEASNAAYGGAVMATFLGNHDVERFIAHASGEVDSLYGDGACDGDDLRTPEEPPTSTEPYDRLKLAWTFLLTTEGLPLIYYGDEIGLPGYADPDNRQMMRFDDELSANEAAVLAHVQALGQARRDHPALSVGTRTEWWENDADVWGWARVSGSDQALVIVNRGTSSRTVSNGLAFAGLSNGTFEDVLTGDTFTGASDTISVTVGARSSRVLVKR